MSHTVSFRNLSLAVLMLVMGASAPAFAQSGYTTQPMSGSTLPTAEAPAAQPYPAANAPLPYPSASEPSGVPPVFQPGMPATGGVAPTQQVQQPYAPVQPQVPVAPVAPVAGAPATGGTLPAADATAPAAAQLPADPCAAFMSNYDYYAACQDRMKKLQRMQDVKNKRIQDAAAAREARIKAKAPPAPVPAVKGVKRPGEVPVPEKVIPVQVIPPADGTTAAPAATTGATSTTTTIPSGGTMPAGAYPATQ